MSSTLLYLAIVAVWAVVLVPMWLRRDSEAPAFSRILHRRQDALDAPPELVEPAEPVEAPPSSSSFPDRRRGGRAAVIARRRRRTSGLSLLLLAAVAAACAGLAPWWIVAPPLLLLGGHLSLLRVAVEMDAARHRERLEARAAARQAAAEAEETRRREAEEAAAQAEIIELRTKTVFDQYADDGLRAVGD